MLKVLHETINANKEFLFLRVTHAARAHYRGPQQTSRGPQ